MIFYTNLEEQIICLDGVILLPRVSLSAQNVDLARGQWGTEHNGDSHPSPLLNLTRWAFKAVFTPPLLLLQGLPSGLAQPLG